MALQKDPKITDVKNYYENFVQYRTDRTPNSRIRELFRFIDKEIKGKHFKSALDVGCGAGLTTEYLLQYVPNVYGVDLSDERINVARSFGKAKYSQIDYSDDIVVGAYDLVLVLDCLEHILPERRGRFLENVYNSFNEMVLVSIPEPNHLKHLRETNPKILQIVDESIFDEDLSMFTIKEKITKGIYVYYVLTK